MLENKAVTELQQILLEEYGQQLSLTETKLIGNRLVSLYQTILNKNENKYKRLQTEPSK